MYKVVLVEDEIFARQGLRNLIDWERLGYEVAHEADNGEEALQIIADTAPELVITDIRMPVLDGMELIRTVRERGNRETKFIIISGYGDFKYAQQAIKFDVKDFILKPIDEEELTQTLVQLALQIEKDKLLKDEPPNVVQKATERLLKGQASDEELRTFSKLLGWERKGRFHYVLAEMNGIPATVDTATGGPWRRGLSATVLRAAEELRAAVHPIQLLEHKPGLYGFLLRLGSQRQAGIAEAADLFARRLRQQFELPAMVYAGLPASDLAGVHESYRAAGEAAAYKYAFADRRSLVYDEMKKVELRYEEFEPADYAKLLEQMEEGAREQMRSTVDWIFDEMKRKRYAPEAVQNAVARFVFGVIGSIRSMQGDETTLRSLEPILQWHHLPIALEGLKERFWRFVEESADLAAGLRRTNAKGDIVKIKTYIEQHYNEDISLKSIAARFYMNPVYLGQLFKKTYGMYFNDFLLQIRVHNAKRLLRQTEMRVYEIAKNVGFDNSDYFVCKFEKVEGRTPTAYRNELLAK
ncbi:response regulator transcription factor [Cohnella sp. REN36]|uniref:response regulator transcription factor n=1 Tax=Cohnella sp. REN36 TaxID=2887347 RepID=UPI001D14E847|nr:response regulator transcription factor [Cohnella sp. REN36]MCC3375348.1 response regulator transcription factor [Cohnella sp. REN36]